LCKKNIQKINTAKFFAVMAQGVLDASPDHVSVCVCGGGDDGWVGGWVGVHIYTYIIYIYTHIHTYIHTYMYIHTHTHTHTHTQTHTHTGVQSLCGHFALAHFFFRAGSFLSFFLQVYKYFVDNSRVQEYNEYCKEIKDVDFIDNQVFFSSFIFFFLIFFMYIVLMSAARRSRTLISLTTRFSFFFSYLFSPLFLCILFNEYCKDIKDVDFSDWFFLFLLTIMGFPFFLTNIYVM